MKTSLVQITLTATVAALTACGSMPRHQDVNPQENSIGGNRYFQDATTTEVPAVEDTATFEQPVVTDTTPITPPPKIDDAPSTPAVPPAPTSQYPYGKPVPGKKGFVTSPYDDKAGMIDVRDYSPGTKVRDPYTQKIFLVP